MEERIKETAQAIFDKACEIITRRDELQPMLFVIHKNNQTDIVGVKFSNSEEKSVFVEYVQKEIAEKENPDAIIFLDEAWATTKKLDEIEGHMAAIKDAGGIKNLPIKDKIVFVLVCSRGSGTKILSSKIITDKDGKRSCTPSSWMDSSQHSLFHWNW